MAVEVLQQGGMNEIETFYGLIETTADALRIVELCRQGKLGRVSRRLHDGERRLIRSGSVFVFDEVESGIKRWTDGRIWSPSRILGNFLIYRELERKSLDELEGMGETDKQEVDALLDELHHEEQQYVASSVKDAELANLLPWLSEPVLQSSSTHDLDEDQQLEMLKSKKLLNNHKGRYIFKPGGLIKKTISIKIDGHPHHLICYYDKRDFCQGHLGTSSFNEALMGEIRKIRIPPDLIAQQNFRKPLLESSLAYFKGEEELPLVAPVRKPSKRRSSYPGATSGKRSSITTGSELIYSGYVPILPALDPIHEAMLAYNQSNTQTPLDFLPAQLRSPVGKEDIQFPSQIEYLATPPTDAAPEDAPYDPSSLAHPRGLKWTSWLMSPEASQLRSELHNDDPACASPVIQKDPMLPNVRQSSISPFTDQ